MVERYHYAAGASNTSTFCHALYEQDGYPLYPRGCALWLPPTKAAAIATWSGDWRQVLSLSRFVIEDDVPKNAATFLLGASVRQIVQTGAWRLLVTYADEWQGHTGTMYRAAGWQYVGKTKPQRVYVINGRMVARKAGPRTRTHAEMLAMGAVCLGSFPKHKFIKPLPYRRRRPIKEAA